MSSPIMAAEEAMKQLQILQEKFLTSEFVQSIKQLYAAVGPEMPTDMVPQTVSCTLPEGVDAQYVSKFNHDEGHGGRFSLFGCDGASLDPKAVFDKPDPLGYVSDTLSYGDVDTGECVVFVPGLNTPHQKYVGGASSPERVKYYTDVLEGRRMAQVHMGSSMDQGELRIDTRKTPDVKKLLMLLEESDFASPREEDGQVFLPAKVIDVLQMCLSYAGEIDTPVKKTVRALLALASPKQPLVLIGYSRGSAEIAAALRQYIAEAEKNGQADVRSRLREAVTVVTIGTPSPRFENGPAYVHMSTTKDGVTKVGVSSHKRLLAGEKATFIQCNTPYAPGAFDNHNFGASLCQYVFLIMHINKVKGFRDLYEKQAKGELVVPENVDEITYALIRETGGLGYLWGEENAKGDGYVGVPDEDDAIAILKRRLGQEVVDRLVSKFHG